ncbi:Adenosine 5'-monophosphoramidase [Elasticomyces elasticus]|nr:Adenosine 5'-monophosphoramidase [Elasticomyces elasticus]KAK3662614.1 Adenosine 5'-monophosphoramidase [Elasticomyces elasticus]KAK4926602.1 Adenosine 5'-monophosphoramidase [Elasticomyces elasticus]KAK5760695.1 Adenosine 5'-monophosphoramidase [Elasticomyces elasticus]
MAANCIFCKIIKGRRPLAEQFPKADYPINPLSYGHTLIIPKHHGAKLTDIPEEHLTELLPIASRIAKASGAENYNVLQNNGRLAHQEVDHVHFHLIPKPNETEGLGIKWPMQQMEKDRLQKLVEEIKSKM